jgi:predicted AAA+ superfamily ATPase
LGSSDRLVGLIGARGVGKTTLLLQYLKQIEKKYLYLSADDITFQDIKLYDIADEFYALGGRILAVDEIHKYPNWARELKNIYDSFPDIVVRFSGSSQLNILYEKFDLSRRAVIYKVDNLTFKEYLELKHSLELESYTFEDILMRSNDISSVLVFEHEYLYGEFKNYLKYGAYPFFKEDENSFDKKLFNALEKIIYEDIPSLNKIDFSQIVIFKKLIFKVISSNKPFKVNIASLSRELGISEPTLYTYLGILQNSDIFKPLKKYSKKISKKPDKLLFRNTNIYTSYANEFSLESDIGTLRETFFVNCFNHKKSDIFYSDIGDFRFEDYIFEIGGKNKDFSQIKGVKDSYLVIDSDYSVVEKKIPLWLFGFLYDKSTLDY